MDAIKILNDAKLEFDIVKEDNLLFLKIKETELETYGVDEKDLNQAIIEMLVGFGIISLKQELGMYNNGGTCFPRQGEELLQSF